MGQLGFFDLNRRYESLTEAGTVLLREDQGEWLTLTVVPTGYLWRETAYASLLCDRGSRRRLCWV